MRHIYIYIYIYKGKNMEKQPKIKKENKQSSGKPNIKKIRRKNE